MKHLTSFILGAAAGIAVYKYASMSREEREEFLGNMKNKATKVKEEAENAMNKAKDYFEELKQKTSEHLSNAERKVKDTFGKSETAI